MKSISSLAPTAVYLVFSKDSDNRIDCAPYSWVTQVSYVPFLVVVAIKPENRTLRNILQTKRFSVCRPVYDDVEKVLWCAKKYPADIDKLVELGIEVKVVNDNWVVLERSVGFMCCEYYMDMGFGDHRLVCGEVKYSEQYDNLLQYSLFHVVKNIFMMAGDIITAKEYN